LAKILLVNPNRYTQPPVPPLGLEYLAAAVVRAGHEYQLLDLTFSDNPQQALAKAIEDYAPSIAGFTVRNIDSAIYHNNLFFLDDIVELVKVASDAGVPTVAGGAGFSFAPPEILAHLGARWAVDGPGEGALSALLDAIERGDPPAVGTVLDGWSLMDTLTREDEPSRLSAGVDYGRYLAEGAIGGFRTQTGCRGTCPFCAEANRKVVFRSPRAVVAELAEMVGRGVKRYHLCDSGFNQDLFFCHELLEAIIHAELGINWALYMKTSPYDSKLFSLLARSGADLVTITYPCGVPDEPALIASAISLAREHGIRVAVDYLCGLPGQSEQDVAHELDVLRTASPDTVGVSNCVRLYPRTASTRRVCGDPSLHGGLLGKLDGNPGLLQPVFYSGIDLESVRKLIGGDPLFKIEGFERSTNYQRLSD
jgi:B12 binding protein/radical SAM family protein